MKRLGISSVHSERKTRNTSSRKCSEQIELAQGSGRARGKSGTDAITASLKPDKVRAGNVLKQQRQQQSWQPERQHRRR